MLNKYGAYAQPRRLRKSRVVTLVCLLAAVMALVWGAMTLYGREMQRRLDREFDRALMKHPSMLPILARRGADLVHPPERGRFALLFASDSSQAELYLALGARLHGLDDAAWLPRTEAPLDMVEVPDDLGHVLRAMPIALRTAAFWETLGETEYRVGHYSQAVRAFETSLRAGRTNPEVDAGLRLAKDSARAVTSIRNSDPSQPAYLLVRELPGSVPRRWVALCGTPDASQAPHFSLSNVKLALWSESQHWRKLWQSPSLRDSRFDGTDYSAARLYLTDLTADGIPEVVVAARLHGASWQPSGVFVYHAETDRLVRDLTVASDEVLFIAPDDLGGRYTVSGDRAVGWDLSHAAQPRWIDYFGWREGRWQNVNADFPSRFEELDREIAAALAGHPLDPELLTYQAQIAEYRQQWTRAQQLYSRALKSVHQRLDDEDDAKLQRDLATLGRRIKSQMRKLPGAVAPQ